MQIKVYKKIIDRYNMPENRALDDHIKKISKELVCVLNTDIVPEIGEILYIDVNANLEPMKYKVVSKIRMLESEPLGDGEYFVLEVVSFSESVVHKNGSDAWTEKIPLVVDVKN